jgi:hypothetical protein
MRDRSADLVVDSPAEVRVEGRACAFRSATIFVGAVAGCFFERLCGLPGSRLFDLNRNFARASATIRGHVDDPRACAAGDPRSPPL